MHENADTGRLNRRYLHLWLAAALCRWPAPVTGAPPPASPDGRRADAARAVPPRTAHAPDGPREDVPGR